MTNVSEDLDELNKETLAKVYMLTLNQNPSDVRKERRRAVTFNDARLNKRTLTVLQPLSPEANDTNNEERQDEIGELKSLKTDKTGKSAAPLSTDTSTDMGSYVTAQESPSIFIRNPQSILLKNKANATKDEIVSDKVSLKPFEEAPIDAHERGRSLYDALLSEVKTLTDATFKPTKLGRSVPLTDKALSKYFTSKEPGEVIAIEKMLVMLKGTKANYVSPSFNENEPIDTIVLERWKEYIVVVRITGNHTRPIALQFYENRNVEKFQTKATRKKRYDKHDTVLTMDTHVKFYSTLDKSIALWRGSEAGTLIYILRPRSHELALRWLSLFLRVLGNKKAPHLPIGIPHLGYVMDVTLPIRMIQQEQQKFNQDRHNRLFTYNELRSNSARASPAMKYLFAISIRLLNSVGFKRQEIVKFVGENKMGLAWRRYDRLEWMNEGKEESMFYSWVMTEAFNLEIRIKQNYSLSVNFGQDVVEKEPIPIEGYLVRLTTWSGTWKKYPGHLHKLFSKPLYFHTHDHFLFYTSLKHAVPTHWAFQESKDPNDVGSSQMFYEVAPFKTDEHGDIIWLKNCSKTEAENHDLTAASENKRRVNMLVDSGGFIDLCNIKTINKAKQVPTYLRTMEHGKSIVVSEQVIEITMDTGISIYLQAFDESMCNIWIERLEELVKYWKIRVLEDVKILKKVRRLNLMKLQLSPDSGVDSQLASTGSKWETTSLDSIADERVFSSFTRTIKMRGLLFQKPKRLSAFTQYHVVLANGHLMLYSLPIGCVNNRKSHAVDLTNSSVYLYSGPITEFDLLKNRDRTFDSQNPGQHLVPRFYSDGWKSSEPEGQRSFALWFGRKKPLRSKAKQRFRKHRRHKSGINILGTDNIKFVNRLGVTGVPMVFMARSRQERDLWVLAINAEIERLAESAVTDIVMS